MPIKRNLAEDLALATKVKVAVKALSEFAKLQPDGFDALSLRQ
ncbi:hypothetical protein LMG3441_06014 [Achromobacter kerstersii]|uniref:Uncharacterized protein n=2 Tax=Achromobacter kerstersii TaxID=1353890 RepID=A0A6S7AZB5_9BURK|nr:hypothetical protein LMG3441_06014 [Achromobacter kerstersii]